MKSGQKQLNHQNQKSRLLIYLSFAIVYCLISSLTSINSLLAQDSKTPEVLTYFSETSDAVTSLSKNRVKNQKNVNHYFYIQGALHGDEHLTTEFVVWLYQRIVSGKSKVNQLDKHKIAIDFLPIANPYGYSKKTRLNINGVNLNRNFGKFWGLSRENPGHTKFSEKETQFIQKMFKDKFYAAAIDVHGYADFLVGPSSPIRSRSSSLSFQSKVYSDWMAALRQTGRQLLNYRTTTALTLGDGGSFEDWAFWEHGALAFCLELQNVNRFSKHPLSKSHENTIDLFLVYENMVYRMFEKAIQIREAHQAEFASQEEAFSPLNTTKSGFKRTIRELFKPSLTPMH